MTTLTISQTRQPRVTLKLLALFLLLAVTPIVYNAHAVEKHGSDAVAIRRCLEEKGPDMVWKRRGTETFYRCVRLEDGRWGLQALKRKGGKLIEKTSFIKGDGTLRALLKYMRKFSTPYKGPLP
jgi:hypothetical protein